VAVLGSDSVDVEDVDTENVAVDNDTDDADNVFDDDVEHDTDIGSDRLGNVIVGVDICDGGS